MTSFRIDASASAELEKLLRQASCQDPVLVLQDMGDPKGAFDDIKALALSGAAPESLATMAEARFDKVRNDLTFRLELSVYERDDCRPEDLVERDGFVFAMAAVIKKAAQPYCLYFHDRQFVLRRRDDNSQEHEVRSIAQLLAKDASLG